MTEAIGLIAGSGSFPLRWAESARRAGHRVVAVAHHDETDPAIERIADEVTWVHLAQFGKMIHAFRAAGVTRAAMAGGITKVRIWGGVRPDLLALKHAAKIRSFNDDDLLRTIAAIFEEEGVAIVDSTAFCPDLLAREGAYTKRKPAPPSQADIELGLRVAREIGRLDVGQTVCVKGLSVVAVEAVEGTDACIRRAAELAGSGLAVVKTAKPQQDMRFDVPCVGPQTVELLARVEAAVLAIEAGRTLVLDEAELTARAEKGKVAVVGLR